MGFGVSSVFFCHTFFPIQRCVCHCSFLKNKKVNEEVYTLERMANCWNYNLMHFVTTQTGFVSKELSSDENDCTEKRSSFLAILGFWNKAPHPKSDEQILRLNISVNNVFAVAVHQCIRHLKDIFSRPALAKFSSFLQILVHFSQRSVPRIK